MEKASYIDLLTRREFANGLRVSEKTVYRLGKTGQITPITISPRIVRYARTDLLKLIANAS